MNDTPRLTHLPIASEQVDCLFFGEKGKQLAQFINNFDGTEPFAYAIYGDWGVGKSSLLNFIERDIDSEQCKVVRFNPWNLTSHMAIIECLFEEIADVVKAEPTILKTLKKYKDKIIRPTVRGVCQYGLTVSGVDDIPAEAVSEVAANIAGSVLSNDDPLP